MYIGRSSEKKDEEVEEIVVGHKFYTLAYADDLSIVAKMKEKMWNTVKEMKTLR